jgi:hypothetical protein
MRRRSFQSIVDAKPRQWYPMKIVTSPEVTTGSMAGRTLRPHDLEELYETAHKQREPLLAPHGFFQRLGPGNNFHAREFLEKFGPLKLTAPQREKLFLGYSIELSVDLQEFWTLHTRFSLFVQLWESLNNEERVGEILLEIYQRRVELAQHGEFPVGTTFGMPPSWGQSALRFPWSQPEGAQRWLGVAPHRVIRDLALRLILSELNCHISKCHLTWQRGWESSGEKFRQVIWVDSLWSTIWEFFGRDTATGAWRRCPHCQKLFYPKRHDQLYCTPRQQSLWSKRRYAAERRAQAHQRRRKDK